MSSLHQRAKDVFLVALAQAGPDRSAFLADACGDDTALRAEVESLLHFHETTGSSDSDERVDTPAAQFAPGQMFAGRYRMVARIGRGGMGDVWRADDVILQTPVALKLIASTANDQAGRILNEVRVARQITHPAVCRVFDVGNADGVVFFTMELVDGEDLAALVRRVGRLPSEKVNDIARQLCGGLAAAHAQGVLHRDLKPGNVLIDNHGQVRITDFGSRAADARSDAVAANRHLRTGPGSVRAAGRPASVQTRRRRRWAAAPLVARAERRSKPRTRHHGRAVDRSRRET
jgi:serine/threonine protein kinase